MTRKYGASDNRGPSPVPMSYRPGFSLVVFLFCIISTITGCGSVSVYDYSRPVIDGVPFPEFRNAKISLNNGDLLLVFHATNMQIRTSFDYVLFVPIPSPKRETPILSRYYGRSDNSLINPDYFVLEVLAITKAETVSFSPANICIQLANVMDGRICPVEWLPVAEPLSSHESGSLCYNAFNLGETKTINDKVTPLSKHELSFEKLKTIDVVRISTKSSVCVALKYPISPPDPKSEFALHFGNVVIDGKLFDVPKIDYLPDSYKGRVFSGS